MKRVIDLTGGGDIEDIVPDKKRAKPAPSVIDISRRNDVPANKEQLLGLLKQISEGRIVYPNPYLARNISDDSKIPDSAWCSVNVSPQTSVLSWWSKDYKNWIEQYHSMEYGPLIKQYTHHFNFTINTSVPGNLIEPGVESGLEERLQQLDFLVNEIAEKQYPGEPGNTIAVRCDPIIVYRTAKGEVVNVVEHIEPVLRRMHHHGLRDFHISFVSLAYSRAVRRAKKLGIEFVKMDEPAKLELLNKYVWPLANELGIVVESCTSIIRDDCNRVVPGGCVPRSAIQTLRPDLGALKTKTNYKAKDQSKCYCVETRDIGQYYPACKHGCLYCYANPVV